MVRLVCIVEGHGEVKAIKILIKRLVSHIASQHPHIVDVIRSQKSRLIKKNELKETVEKAASLLSGQGSILILLDADKDCPAKLGPAMLSWAREARSDLKIAVVIAKCEFEAWFLAAAKSLQGQVRLADHFQLPKDAEAIRDAKGWLTKHMPRGQPYNEIVDQSELTNLFDLDMAINGCPSFRKLYRDMKMLLQED